MCVSRPGPLSPTPDLVTGQPVNLPPVNTDGWASIRQRTTTNLGSSTESTTTTVTLHDGLFEPALAPALVDRATVVDHTTGERYEVDGQPAPRGPFVAAALRQVSDMQEVQP
ncbi:hypothetical protein APASM_4701 [Actinosynnema pretiosum subsp. pretiosum]|nr:hypothetical protein APASM_4701 [Actinosynnema pretiosum subsp. pretiosum]